MYTVQGVQNIVQGCTLYVQGVQTKVQGCLIQSSQGSYAGTGRPLQIFHYSQDNRVPASFSYKGLFIV